MPDFLPPPPPPSLSHLPPCTIPLLMCHSNFGVQDVSSRKRMCFFLCGLFEDPSTPPLLRSHILSQLYFQRTYRRFPTVQSSPANLNSMVGFFFHILSFQQRYIPESHICNHSVENTAFFCFSCLFVSVGSFVRVFFTLYVCWTSHAINPSLIYKAFLTKLVN